MPIIKRKLNRYRKLRSKGGVAFDVEGLIEKRKQFEKELNNPDIWNEREKAQKVTREIKRIKNIVGPWIEAKKQVDELVELYSLAIAEGEEELEAEIISTLRELTEKIDALEKLSLFKGEHDTTNAYLTIHSGAGGTEACDWVSMLLRMYLRWAENHHYKTEIVDILPGEEAGIKSVTVYV